MIRFVKPSFEILHMADMLKTIELAGRVCYKSEGKITEDSAADFCEMILNRGHESVIEHAVATVRFICDRGVTHELVRHRLASFSQESTRYCNYGRGVTFVIPPWVSIPEGSKDEIPTNGLDYPTVLWLNAMNSSAIFTTIFWRRVGLRSKLGQYCPIHLKLRLLSQPICANGGTSSNFVHRKQHILRCVKL